MPYLIFVMTEAEQLNWEQVNWHEMKVKTYTGLTTSDALRRLAVEARALSSAHYMKEQKEAGDLEFEDRS